MSDNKPVYNVGSFCAITPENLTTERYDGYILNPREFKSDEFELILEPLPNIVRVLFDFSWDWDSFVYDIVYILKQDFEYRASFRDIGTDKVSVVREWYGVLKEWVNESTIYHLATLTPKP